MPNLPDYLKAMSLVKPSSNTAHFICILPMDVSKPVDDSPQELSPQSAENVRVAVEKYEYLTKYLCVKKSDIKFVVVGANGYVEKGENTENYLVQKIKGVLDKSKKFIKGDSEADLIKRTLEKDYGFTSDQILHSNSSHNTVENAEVLAMLVKSRINNQNDLSIYLVANETLVVDGQKSPQSLYDSSGRRISSDINVLTKSHLERAMYTFKRILSRDLKQWSVEIIPVPTKSKYGEGDENTQDHLKNPNMWLIMNLGSLVWTIIQLSPLKNDFKELKDFRRIR